MLDDVLKLKMADVSNKRVALVAGASGLTGGLLLRMLLEAPDYARVHALSRRPLTFDHIKLANRIMPLEEAGKRLTGFTCHDAFCCIGSTRREAGSDAELRRVDVDLAVTFARAALACGAQRLVVLSSAGANPASRYPYLRNKAEMERILRSLGFVSLDILQPGMLLGLRREVRPLELLGMALSPLARPFLTGPRAAWRSIAARDVAAAMIGAARSMRRGVYVYAGEGLAGLARAGYKADVVPQ
jgi:uncharacterized protein YbjT (DUF2867 family)